MKMLGVEARKGGIAKFGRNCPLLLPRKLPRPLDTEPQGSGATRFRVFLGKEAEEEVEEDEDEEGNQVQGFPG